MIIDGISTSLPHSGLRELYPTITHPVEIVKQESGEGSVLITSLIFAFGWTSTLEGSPLIAPFTRFPQRSALHGLFAKAFWSIFLRESGTFTTVNLLFSKALLLISVSPDGR